MSQEIGRIKKLDETVINRIAAGEIIIQPSNALKELIENSIDAEATMIDIIVRDGGLKLLQLTDNGKGINKEDMSLLCERFSTSKLEKYEDLDSIATYGFRGEALASISHISRLSVITKVRESSLAYKGFYSGGVLCTSAFKPGTSNQVSPKPVAGKDGTQVIVEDLFYNTTSRLKALRSKSEEYSKILDVVSKYAIHCDNVGFGIKKFGESTKTLATRPGLEIKERIRTVFGNSIANELIEVQINTDDIEDQDLLSKMKNTGLKKVKGAISNTNYVNKKKIQPIFFINNRLVTCNPLKKALLPVFQYFLLKGNQPFIYLSLEIDPRNVDVNIHPTKSEVRFLYEDAIIELICNKVHGLLSSVDSSRKYKTQSIFSNTEKKRSRDDATYDAKIRQENKLVRVDAQQSKIISFLSNQSQDEYNRKIQLQSQKDSSNDIINLTSVERDNRIENDENIIINDENQPEERFYTRSTVPRKNVNLDSVKFLRAELADKVHKPLTNIFNNSSYIGIVDESKRLCCFQYDINLYICDYSSVLSEFYYQVALSEFSNFGKLLITEIPLEEILQPLYKIRDDLKPISEIINNILSMKDMFEEYFQIKFSENDDGKPTLFSLPIIMKGIYPCVAKIPHFLYRLGAGVNYDEEKECLKGVLQQIALLYVPEIIVIDSQETAEAISDEEKELLRQKNDLKRKELDISLEQTVFPLLKQRFLATKELISDVMQIADLPGLYRVFERC